MSSSTKTTIVPRQEFDRLVHELNGITSTLYKHLDEDNPRCMHNIREILQEAFDRR